VKNSFILIPLILFIFIITVIILAALNIFFFWGISYSSVAGLTHSAVIKGIPYRIFQVIAVSVFATIVLISFRILKKPPSRFLSFLIILITAYSILVLSVIGVLGVRGKAEIEQRSIYKLIPEKMNSFKRYTVFPIKNKGGRENSFVILDRNSGEKNKISYIQRGMISWDKSYLVIKDKNKVARVKEKNALPVVAEIFKKGKFVDLFLRDLDYFNEDVLRLYNSSFKTFLILLFSVTFFFTVCGIFMRITRWPLFNIFLSFAVMRGFFSFYHWLQLKVLPETISIFTMPHFSNIFPSIVIGAISLLLVLLDILFVPFNYWEKEIAE